MKNFIKIVGVSMLMGMASCNYLDVVPNDTATLDHTFSNRSVMDKFLRTVYSYLPDPTNPHYYPAYFTSRDEFDWRTDVRAGNRPAGQISQGNQNSNSPYLDYWSGRNGGTPMYEAIRTCNIFLENAHLPQDIDEQERQKWIAETKFLKAYYHFFLMQLYGPIVVVRENLPPSASSEEVMAYREPIDDVVAYIVELLDEAIPNLPLVIQDPNTEQGRISQVIALGIKAKVLAWAASPLFNGNPDYAGWEDNRGVQLIPSIYDDAKWARAAEASREAIDAAHAGGYQLYEFNKFSTPQTFAMNDTLVTLMTVRKAITEDIERNTGVIWATQEQFANGKGGVSLSVLGNMMRSLFPNMYAEDQPLYLNYLSASWHMGELFYTNNGVPMEEDKYFDYDNRYNPRRATPGDHHESYIATNQVTATMHFNREPRFYANLVIDRGFFELASTTEDGGKSFGPFVQSRGNDIVGTAGQASYTPKKILPFESSSSQGVIGRSFTQHNYHFPLLRLSDLYLLYAEALNETKTQPDEEVYHWIDQVRDVAGLNGVVDSWREAAYDPDAPNNKNDMRRIIQKERLIELAFEGQRFWDVRRWKIADQYWSLPPTRWGDTDASSDEAFYIPTVYADKRQITFRDYLFPINIADLRVNTNLVQTYGW